MVIRWGKVKPCLHTAVQVLLPCCQQALPEAGLKALRTVQPQPAGACRQAGAVAQRLPQALQPVIPNRGVKLLRPIHPFGAVRRYGTVRVGGLYGQAGLIGAALQAGPAVAPFQLLDGGLAPEDAVLLRADGARAQVCQKPAAVRPLRHAGVARLLQRVGRVRPCRDQRLIGAALIRAFDMAAAQHHLTVAHTGAALGTEKVIPAVLIVERRALGRAAGAAAPEHPRLADQALLGLGVFLHHNARKADLPCAVLGRHVQQVFAAVRRVEQGRVKPAAVQKYRLAPRAADVRCRDKVVVHIVEGSAEVVDIGIDQVEFSIAPAQVGRPDTAGIGHAGQIQLALAGQRGRQALPMGKIAGVKEFYAGPPLKGGGCQIPVLPDTEEGRIGVKPLQNGICQLCHYFTPSGRRSQCPRQSISVRRRRAAPAAGQPRRPLP